MADANYERLKAQVSTELFGMPIAVGNMTPEQRKRFQERFNQIVKSGGGHPGAAQGYIEMLAQEVNPQTNPYPGTRPVDMGSAQRAAAVGQINDAYARDVANRNRMIGDLQGTINTANQTDINAIGSLTSTQDRARDQFYGIAGNVRNDAQAANDLSAQLFGGYAAGQGALNAQDQAGFDRYIQETNPLMTRQTARGSDPADLARQMASYQQGQDIYGGALDYQAAQYASNPADIQRQMQGYNDLRAVGQGSLDYQAALAQAVLASTERHEVSARDIENQRRALEDIRKDLYNGSKDQREVMGKFKALSDPEVTAKERFLSELARREFEAADRSSRGAVSQNLAMRGLRSGGQEIAMQQAERQQIAQDRLLKELGIQAGAVDRSMQALGGWGNAANAIRASDQNALGLQGNMVNTIRAQNDQVGMFNAAEANTTNRFNAGLQTNTNQFNAAQKNQASRDNQATRFAGYAGAANQANAIRSANDYVGTFNTQQVNTARANNQATRMQGANLSALQSNAIRSANDSQRQFEDSYAQNESIRVGNLAGQRAQEGRATTAQIGSRQSDVHGAGQSAITNAFGRSQDANVAQWDATKEDLGMGRDYFDAVTGAADRSVSRQAGLTGTSMTAGAQGTNELIRKLGINNNQWAVAQEYGLSGGF